ncbi:MAG TPA: TlpA disulfide reductase family protein [Candidatus Binatia bacterium]|nr:TlpA disulfide reductase family protein [Candidatus Binatia bacterium]
MGTAGWLNCSALRLSDLRGKVILIRWWTAPGCHYCVDTAPAPNEFHRDYAKRGLQVISAYHHKSDDKLDPKQVERGAKKFGFKFPVAIDPDWLTLKRWYLNNRDTAVTSLTFLVDPRQPSLPPSGRAIRQRRSRLPRAKGTDRRLLAAPQADSGSAFESAFFVLFAGQLVC